MFWTVFNAITLAFCLYVFLPYLLVELMFWIKERRQIRKERERLDELLAAHEAERDRYRQATDL